MKMQHVPYRNIAQYGPDLIAGIVPLGFQWFPNIAGPVGAKGAIPLAVAGDQRLPALPDTPTTTEAGLPEYKVNGWFALLAPGGTPRPILERLNKEMATALNDPEVRKSFESAGAVTMALPLDTAKKFHIDEIAKYRDIITKAGIPQIYILDRNLEPAPIGVPCPDLPDFPPKCRTIKIPLGRDPFGGIVQW